MGETTPLQFDWDLESLKHCWSLGNPLKMSLGIDFLHSIMYLNKTIWEIFSFVYKLCVFSLNLIMVIN